MTEVAHDDLGRVRPRWHRVVLKLSGEALASSLSDETIDASTVGRLAKEIGSARSELDIQIAIVVGGGNIWRGTTGAGQGMDRATSDIMGMLGTVINALALQDALERVGCPTRVLSAIHMAEVCEPYIRRRAIRHLEKGRVVDLRGGDGKPLLHDGHPGRAAGGRDRGGRDLEGDPFRSGRRLQRRSSPRRRAPPATRRSGSSRSSVRDLRVMDHTAVTFCRDNAIPILVFDLMREGNIRAALVGERIGTLIR